MPAYTSPDSSIVFYEVLFDDVDELLITAGEPIGILIEFEDGSVYRWLADTVGDDAIQTMIDLAERGDGLGSWIYENVRFDYS